MVILHGLEEIEGTGDIIIVISQRLLDRFGDGFQASKMNDEVERFGTEELVELVGVEEVDFVEIGLRAGDLLDFV